MVTVTVKEYHGNVGAVVFCKRQFGKGGIVFIEACKTAMDKSKESDGTFIVYENKKKVCSYKNGQMK